MMTAASRKGIQVTPRQARRACRWSPGTGTATLANAADQENPS